MRQSKHSKKFPSYPQFEVFRALALAEGQERYKYSRPRTSDVAAIAEKSTARTHKILKGLHELKAVYYPDGERRVLRISEDWQRLAGALRREAA